VERGKEEVRETLVRWYPTSNKIFSSRRS